MKYTADGGMDIMIMFLGEVQMVPEKLGISLSGGGIRGMAHIGVLKALRSYGIYPDIITGTSMGSIVAAALAVGTDLDEIEQFALQFSHTRNMMRMVHLASPHRGLLDPDKVRTELSEIIPPDIQFSDLKIPLAVCATDLNRSRSVALHSGNVLNAVMASISIPGLFPAVDMPPYRLVDGGVLNNVPVDLAYRLGATRTIVVDVQLHPEKNSPWQKDNDQPDWPVPVPPFYLDLLWSILMMMSRISNENLENYRPDLILRPAIPRDISIFMGFNRTAEIISYGEEAVNQAADQVQSLFTPVNVAALVS